MHFRNREVTRALIAEADVRGSTNLFIQFNFTKKYDLVCVHLNGNVTINDCVFVDLN